MRISKMKKKVYFDFIDMVKEIVSCDVIVEYNFSNNITFVKNNSEITIDFEFSRGDTYIGVDYIYPEYDYEEEDVELKYYLYLRDIPSAIKGAEIQSFIELETQLKEVRRLLEY